MPNLVELMKQASLEAVENSKPAGICFGTVLAVSPLTIRLDQKTILDDSYLILTSLVSDFDVDMAVDHVTENTSGGSGESAFASHNHAYKGTKKFSLKLGLKAGEKVIMLRVQGGQKFIVWDRVR